MIVDPIAFSRVWLQAWNSRDVEAVRRHFHNDVVFTSPVAARLSPKSRGVVLVVEGHGTYLVDV